MAIHSLYEIKNFEVAWREVIEINGDEFFIENISLNKTGTHLDETDIKILEYLAKDCRIGYAEIARKVHLSRMSVRSKVMNMIEKGMIERFTVQLDSRKIGLNILTFLAIRAESRKMDYVGKTLAKLPQIESVYATTGSNILHTHAFLEDFYALENFIYEKIYTIDGVIDVQLNIMTKKYKATRLFT